MKKNNYLRDNRKRNSGFTLVEMVITVVVIAIVAGLMFSGITAWQRWSDFRRENEYAQTLFVAAQNQLSEYGANGRLGELQKDILGMTAEEASDPASLQVRVGTYLSPSVLEHMKDETGAAYNMESIWPESVRKGDPDKYRKKIVAIKAEAGLFAEYSKNPEEFKKINPEAYWVYELLASYVYDTSILNEGAVSVEFTPQDGQVFAVVYSDKNASFHYLAAGESGGTDISDREETVRESGMIGFYGVNSLYASTRNQAATAAVSGVQLHNKETFYLTFKLSKNSGLTSALTYSIDLLDAETGSARLGISLDGTKLKNERNAANIDCPVIRYPVKTDASGNAILGAGGKPQYESTGVEIGTFPILAWLEADNTVHVLLDAADIQATAYLYDTELPLICKNEEYASKTKFSDTYSFFRFGVETDRRLQASVSATGDGIASTDNAVSRTAKTPCFAQGTRKVTEAGDEFQYVVENGRHFYNIRYIEGVSYEKQEQASALTKKIARAEMKLKSGIDWASFRAEGNVYDTFERTSYVNLSQIGYNRYNCPFPSFTQVRERDTLNGNGRTVSGLQISETANALYDSYSVGEFSTRVPTRVRPCGLVDVNYGTMKDLKIDSFTVSGTDMVGGFCGINAGEADGLVTLNTEQTSRITGYTNVGGIIGFQVPTGTDTTVSNLTNHATVEGRRAVGGILGSVQNEFGDVDFSEFSGFSADTKNLLRDPTQLVITVRDCKNYGRIQAASTAAADEEFCYFGGIAGYCYDRYKTTDTVGKIRIQKCVGAPVCEADEIQAILAGENPLTEKGIYVGGIVGYNDYGRIEECSLTPLTGKQSLIVGAKYVGGIAGYNNGTITGGEQKVISANVRGKSYVGGLAGYNDQNGKIENCEIKGGTILGEEGCFVGGFVGLNSSYDLIYENGTGTTRALYSNPELVKGAYFVGATFGGTVLNTKAAPDMINAVYRSGLFSGRLEAKAFAGGYTGYLALLSSEDGRAVYSFTKEIDDTFEKTDVSGLTEEKALQKRLNELNDLQAGSSDKKLVLRGDNTGTANGVIKAGIYAGGVLGYVDKSSKLLVLDMENRNHVEGTLAIENKEEQKKILPDHTVTYRETNYAGDSYGYTYSYAGGITGKVEKNTTLENCSNHSTATIKTKGTYTGALCEINAGHITDCKIQNFGNPVTDYVGGLCGLNSAEGRIDNCNFIKAEIKGRNVVGGVCAENFGKIAPLEINTAKVTASGVSLVRNSQNVEDGVCGVLVGHNGETGKLELTENIKDVTVKSDGAFVGLIIGYNHGQITNRKVSTPNEDTAGNLTLSGTIEGNEAVGALIGCNDDVDGTRVIANYTNLSTVRSKNGQAGGIIGINTSKNTILYCENKALVVATDNGDCGGITSINDGKIMGCRNYVEISAKNGMCGGITAFNDKNGKIINCIVKAENDGKVLKFMSNDVVGGIAAKNAGLIQGNKLSYVNITNDERKSGTAMGIITGKNLRGGRILFDATDTSLEADIDHCKVRAESNNCKMGGIAGTNEGEIAGYIDAADQNKISSVVNVTLEFGKASYASMGGVAGVNTGKIDHIAVEGDIAGNLGSSNIGYGGIVGFNGFTNKGLAESARALLAGENGSKPEYVATITYCTFDGSLHANGSSGNLAKIGGITGVNSYGAKITNCAIGTRIAGNAATAEDITYITAGDLSKDSTVNGTDKRSAANIGGIAGENYSFITDIDNQKYTKDQVKIISFTGSAGGICGRNFAGGKITGYAENEGQANEIRHKITTGDTWSIEMRCSENDRGPGGIIGLNESGNTIAYVDNRAFVTNAFPANVKCGGIIANNQQTEAEQLNLKNCNNFGTIMSYNSVGGFVGHNFYKGMSFTDCVNYGEVGIIEESAGVQRYAGGFIGQSHTVTTGYNFTSCANHGYIHNNSKSVNNKMYAAGFIAFFTNFSGQNNYMTDCVNTGIIGYAGEQAATDTGIKQSAASFLGNADKNWYLNLCRNYNTETEGNVSGFVVNGGTVVLKDCLDTSGIKTNRAAEGYSPFGGSYSANSMNNYFLNLSSARYEEEFDEDSHGAYFSVHQGTKDEWKIFVDMGNEKWYRDFRNNAYLLSAPSFETRIISANGSSPAALNFSITQGENYPGIDAFVMYFSSYENKPGDPNLFHYYYKVYMVDKNGTMHLADIDTSSLPEGAVNNTYKSEADGAWNGVTVKGTDDYTTYRVAAKVPAGVDTKDIDSIIFVTNDKCSKNTRFYGFTWIPTGQTKEAVLTPLYKKTGVRVDSVSTSSISNCSNSDRYDYLNMNGNLRADLLDLNYYLPGNNGEIRLDAGGTRDGNDAWITLNLDYGENALEMDKLNIYLSNGKLYRTNMDGVTEADDDYSYRFYYKLTDMNGKVYEIPRNRAQFLTVTKEQGQMKAVIDVAALVADDTVPINTQKLKKIELKIKNSSVNGGAGTRYVYIRGITWEPSDHSGEQRFAWYNKATSDQYLPNYKALQATNLWGVKKLIADYSGYHGGTASAPYVYAAWNKNLGFNMSANDPINANYYADKQALNLTNYTPTSDGNDLNNREGILYDENGEPTLHSGVTNSRISVYRDIDPKFVALIEKMYELGARLKTPGNVKVKLENGGIVLTWKRVTQDITGKVASPYGYEIAYEIVDENGTLIEKGSTFQAEQSNGNADQYWANPITIKKEWSDKDYTANFTVRAISANHFSDPENNMDSDPSDPVSLLLRQAVLVTPKVHLETTAGNKTVAILENREEYLDPENDVWVQDEEGNFLKTSMANVCTIYVDYNGMKLEINPAEGFVSTEAAYMTNAGYSPMTAVAKPKAGYETNCTDSTKYLLRGEGIANSALAGKGYYCDTDFNGFFGSDTEGLTYEIVYRNSKDAYIMADIGGYDENIGAFVYYGRDITHVAASESGNTVKQTSVLQGIPKEWFAESLQQSMEVRSFMYRGQNYFIHYGHDVKTGIVLDGRTKEENQAILKSITDPYHVGGDRKNTQKEATADILITDYPVWDTEKGCLKPGYTLYQNEDGTYDLIYNATLELSVDNADEYMVSHPKSDPELPDRRYYNFAVNVQIYDNMSTSRYPYVNRPNYPISPDSIVNVSDFQESYWIRVQNRVDENNWGFNYYRKDTSDPRYIVEIQPAPIPDGDIVMGTDENGKTTYYLSWDTYYQDTYCWNLGTNPSTKTQYSNNDWRYLTRLGFADTYADPDAVNPNPDIATWKAFREKGALYDEYFEKLLADPNCYWNGEMRKWMFRTMQGYYMVYADASYKAEMIGTTIDGDEVILQTKYVDTATALPSYYDSYTVYTKADRTSKVDVSTEYKRWNYEATFTDEEGTWDQYEKVSVRLTRLGSDTTPGNFNRDNGRDTGYNFFLRLGNLGVDGVTRALIRLPRYAEISVSQKDKLAMVAAPVITQTAEEDAAYPYYNITWQQITDSAMAADVGGYLFTVEDASAENALPAQYYYVNTLAADSGESLTVDKLLKDIIPINVSDKYVDNGDTTATVSLDLSAFDGRYVQIKVRALARDNTIVNPTLYMHGDNGEAAKVKVLKDLPVPDVTKVGYSSEEEIKVNRNVIFTYRDGDDIYKDLGLIGYAIEAAIAVYDEVPENGQADMGSTTPGDATGENTGCWNEEARITLYTKETPLVIGGTASSGSLVDNLMVPESILTDYAGKYLKMTIRTNGENTVNSKWTDEDEADATLNYVWISLPKAQVEDVEITEGESGEAVTEVTASDGTTATITYTLRQIRFPVQGSLISEYTIGLKKNSNLPENMDVKIPESLVLVWEGSAFALYNADKTVKIGELSEAGNRILLDENAGEGALMQSSRTLTLQEAVQDISGGNAIPKVTADFSMYGEIRMEDISGSRGTFTITLPQIVQITATYAGGDISKECLGFGAGDGEYVVNRISISRTLSEEAEKTRELKKNPIYWKREEDIWKKEE